MKFKAFLKLLAAVFGLLTVTHSFAGATSFTESKDKQATFLQKRIHQYLSEASQIGFSGAVLVAKDNKIIVNRGYGQADKENNIANTPITIFDTGSVTKQFTAAAILKLQELNKLKVTDSLEKYFDKLPADKKQLTLHQLLSHSSGIVGGIGNGDFHHIPTEEYFKQLFATDLLHQPGSKYYYSNAGYSILARVVEIVSGQNYEDFLQQHLFAPAGMSATGYLSPDWSKYALSNGYHYNVFSTGSMATRYKQDGKISWVLKGNGGISSTQEDMYRWYLALAGKKVLSEDSFKQLSTGHIREYEGEESYYGYGWATFKSPRGTKVISHNGSNGVFYYDFVMLPEENTVILFATNTLTRPLYGIPGQIERMLFDNSFKPKNLNQDPLTLILEDAIKFKGSSEALANQVKEKYAESLKGKRPLNRLGMTLQKHGYFDQAIGLFLLNIELFPGDGNLWDSLGEAQFAKKDFESAQKSFQKALELKPESNCYWCDNANNRLKEINSKLK